MEIVQYVQYLASKRGRNVIKDVTHRYVHSIQLAESRKEGERLADRVRESSLSCPASTPTRRWTSAQYHSTSRHRRSVTSPTHLVPVFQVPNTSSAL
jgi:hypothetical protein